MAAIENDSLRKRAMAAAAALLGTPLAAQSQSPKNAPAQSMPHPTDTWTWDTSYLHYQEAERITVSEPQVGVTRSWPEARSLSVLATVDTISGATPLGTLPATPNTAPATITGPSGRAVNPLVGKVPTSDMTDTRIALNVAYERPQGDAGKALSSVNISKEHDFFSVGAGHTWDRDFFQKNSTLSLGVGPEFDIVKPHNGLPYAYAAAPSVTEFQGTSRSKYLLSGILGWTQVMTPKTVMQLTYSPTYENGYLNDPYKLLSLVNAVGDPLSSVHEQRPGSRFGQSLYWLTRYNITGRDVFSLGLRLYGDDWGIHSQTIDFTYRWQYHARRYFEPHVRYYKQSAADFFTAGLLNGAPLPAHASADYRLTEMDSVTFGVRWGWGFDNGSELILRAEYYMATGDETPHTAIGLQRTYDLFPTINATILQIEYKFNPAAWRTRA